MSLQTLRQNVQKEKADRAELEQCVRAGYCTSCVRPHSISPAIGIKTSEKLLPFFFISFFLSISPCWLITKIYFPFLGRIFKPTPPTFISNLSETFLCLYSSPRRCRNGLFRDWFIYLIRVPLVTRLFRLLNHNSVFLITDFSFNSKSLLSVPRKAVILS